MASLSELWDEAEDEVYDILEEERRRKSNKHRRKNTASNATKKPMKKSNMYNKAAKQLPQTHSRSSILSKAVKSGFTSFKAARKEMLIDINSKK